MAFTVDDFEDLHRLLSERPEWRARLRPLILGDEYVQLPERMGRVEEQLILIGERLDALGERLDQVVTALQLVIERLNRMDGRMGNIEGDLLELRYKGNLRNWIGKYLWPVEMVGVDDLPLVSAALSDGRLSHADVDRLRELDLLVKGNTRNDPASETLLAGEVSQTINVDDVERAADRAGALRRAGYATIGFAGGTRLGGGAEERATELEVVIDLHRPAA